MQQCISFGMWKSRPRFKKNLTLTFPEYGVSGIRCVTTKRSLALCCLNAGWIRDPRRNSGAVQKDWAVGKSNTLPDHFCIALVGNQGCSHDPDSAARYAFAVTFEILGREISIYDPLRLAVTELQLRLRKKLRANQKSK
jgi:hypothetical protein